MSRFRDGMVWAFLSLLALNLAFAAADAIKTAQISSTVGWLKERVIVSQDRDTISEGDRANLNEQQERMKAEQKYLRDRMDEQGAILRKVDALIKAEQARKAGKAQRQK